MCHISAWLPELEAKLLLFSPPSHHTPQRSALSWKYTLFGHLNCRSHMLRTSPIPVPKVVPVVETKRFQSLIKSMNILMDIELHPNEP